MSEREIKVQRRQKAAAPYHPCMVYLPAFTIKTNQMYPGIPTTIKTMDVNITTIFYLRVLIIQIGSTIVLMVVEALGVSKYTSSMDGMGTKRMAEKTHKLLSPNEEAPSRIQNGYKAIRFNLKKENT